MIDLIEIDIKEFEDTIYEEYTKLFPKEERRSLKKIKVTFNEGKERIYKIVKNYTIIGFFMLEKISEEYPYYLDYFAIFSEYQNQGYGTQAIKKLLSVIVDDKGLCFEIEKKDEKNPITLKRAKFYENLGFKEIDSEYFVYDVFYTPYIYSGKIYMDKEKVDKTIFEYYTLNAGENAVKKFCKIVK